jgi:uncharacterized protein YdcH (DUF465 family)
LFEIKEEYADTGRLLADMFKTAIPNLPAKANDDQRNIFHRAIADLEKHADQGFDVLVAEMRKNKLLLKTEADELIQRIEKDRVEIMDLLKKSVEAATPSPSNK